MQLTKKNPEVLFLRYECGSNIDLYNKQTEKRFCITDGNETFRAGSGCPVVKNDRLNDKNDRSDKIYPRTGK